MFTEEQKDAISFTDGPALVLGTPGSGKTTVIINRINNLIYGCGVSPSSILVITFTRAAAESMKQRFLEMNDMESTGVRFGTFHSFFFWIIRTAYGQDKPVSVMDEGEKRSVIKSILLDINREMYGSDEILNAVLSQFSIIASDMIDIENYYSTNMSQEDFIKVYKNYSSYKQQKGMIDFDDMLTMCFKLLTERKDIAYKIRQMYPYIMVDEFQDTNLLQYEVLKQLTYPDGNLYVVGDDDQSIYGFRGARPDILKAFEREYFNVTVMKLSQNFRCPAIIVRNSAEVIKANKNRFDKELISASGKAGTMDISSVQDIRKENELVINRILKALSSGVSPDEIAVLYRTNYQPRRLMYKLRENAIDFNVRDQVPDIFSHPIVTPVLGYIAFALGKRKRSIFISFMNKPLRYISRDMIKSEEIDMNELLAAAGDKDYLRDNIRRLNSELRTISSLNPYAAINYIRDAIGYNTYLKKFAEENGGDYEEMSDILDELQSMTKGLETFGEMYDMIDDYRKLLALSKEEGYPEERPRVQLMTLHSAKGLEFKEVHILDAVEGYIPHRKSRSIHEIEEERRMLYVGMTRSSDKLYMYVPRIMGERIGKPSRFIETLKKGTIL